MIGQYSRNFRYFLGLVTTFCAKFVLAIKCPEGLPLGVSFVMPTTGSCYFLTTSTKSITEAALTCESVFGGHIVFYETQAEQTVMESELINNWSFSGVKYWLGLDWRSDDLYWTMWNYGHEIPVTFTDWSEAPTSGSYAVMESGQSWKEAATDDTNAVICELDNPLFVTETNPSKCPPGLSFSYQFVLSETKSCYFSDNRGYKHVDGRPACESVTGGHIVHIETSDENSRVSAKLRSRHPILPPLYWLGMERLSGSWEWRNVADNTDKPVTWTKWLIVPIIGQTIASFAPLTECWEGEVPGLDVGINYLLCEIDNTVTPAPASGTSTPAPTEIQTDNTTPTVTTSGTSTLDNTTPTVTASATSTPAPDAEEVDESELGIYELRTGIYEILSTAALRSALECAVLCSRDPSCRGVHFRVNIPPECVLLKSYTDTAFNCTIFTDCYIKLF